MRTAGNIKLMQLEGMSLDGIISFISECGYCTEALSNDEMYDLAVSILDGHEDEGGDPEDLDFEDQGSIGLARFMEMNSD
jgi:hypothetical protein